MRQREYDIVLGKCARVREDCAQALSSGFSRVKYDASGILMQQEAEFLAAMKAVLTSREGHALLLREVDRAEQAARDAAVAEAQALLEECVREVMES